MANPVIGYLHCGTCDTRATMHQTQRGKNKNFYRNCGCGCDQRTGVVIQKKWRTEFEPLPEYAHLKLEPVQPKAPENKPIKAEEVPKPEPEKREPQSSPKPKFAGVLAVLPVVGMIGLALLTLGRSNGLS